MSRIESLANEPGDPWRYGLLGGLASIPFTTAGYWQTGSELSFAPVFVCALFAGFLARRATGSAEGVGVRAGAVGALPAGLLLGEILGAAGGLAGPSWFVGLATVSTVGFVVAVGVLAVALSAVVGALGARVGGWVATRTGPSGPRMAGS